MTPQPPARRVPLTTASHLERTPGQTAPAAVERPAAAEGSETIQVRATRAGFYADSRRKVGAEFSITLAPGEKMPSWVERI